MITLFILKFLTYAWCYPIFNESGRIAVQIPAAAIDGRSHGCRPPSWIVCVRQCRDADCRAIETQSPGGTKTNPANPADSVAAASPTRPVCSFATWHYPRMVEMTFVAASSDKYVATFMPFRQAVAV